MTNEKFFEECRAEWKEIQKQEGELLYMGIQVNEYPSDLLPYIVYKLFQAEIQTRDSYERQLNQSLQALQI